MPAPSAFAPHPSALLQPNAVPQVAEERPANNLALRNEGPRTSAAVALMIVGAAGIGGGAGAGGRLCWEMARTAAGLFLFRHRPGGAEVLLVHLGGPFWARKDHGAWSLPKGEPLEGEELAATALREFHEETGYAPHGAPFALGQVKQPGGKVVHAWALEGDFDVQTLTSNTFTVESPKGSGQFREYPEVDRAEWFTFPAARERLIPAQVPLLDVLAAHPAITRS